MPVKRNEGKSRFSKTSTLHSGGRKTKTIDAGSLRSTEATAQNERLEATRLAHKIDQNQGFERFEAGKKRTGWLVNMHSTNLEDSKVPGGRAAVDYYFIDDDGTTFKASVEYLPYFMIAVKKGKEAEVEEWVRRNCEGLVKTVDRLEKEMRAVQRKVFPGGTGLIQPDVTAPTVQPTAPGAPASSAVVDLTARVTSLEQQMATMTGQIEQTGFQLRTLRDQFDTYKRATDARLAAPAPAAGGPTEDDAPRAAARAEPEAPVRTAAATPSRSIRPAAASNPLCTFQAAYLTPHRRQATRTPRASRRPSTVMRSRNCSPLTNSVGVPRTPLRTPELKSASTRSSTNCVLGQVTLAGGMPSCSA